MRAPRRVQFGKASKALVVPVTTLRELCEQHVPRTFDFLKVDVEGAEQDVLLNGDWQNYRPKVVVVEALAPYTMTPAWAAWEPFLAKHGYRYVWFDTLNRYYVAEEADELARCFETAPASFDQSFQFRNVKPALADEVHPDHRLASLLAGAAMTRLPLLERDLLIELLTGDIARLRTRATRRRERPGTGGRAVVRAKGGGVEREPEAAPCPAPARHLRRADRQRRIPRGLRSHFGELCLVRCRSRRFGLPGPRCIRYTA